MVSRLDEGGQRTNAERRSQASVESKVVLGLSARDVTLRIVESAADDHVRLGAGAGKREEQIAQRCNDAKISGSWTAYRSGPVQELVVDPIEPYSDRKFGYANGENCECVVARALGVAQFADRNCAASARAQRVRLLGQQGRGQHQGAGDGNSRGSKKQLHNRAGDGIEVRDQRAGNIADSRPHTRTGHASLQDGPRLALNILTT